MATYEVFATDRHEHVGTLWLANPERRNAMGPAFWDELPRAIGELDADDAVRAIVLAARGPHFTVGLDLKAMGGGIAEGGGGGVAGRRRLLDMIARLQGSVTAVARSLDEPGATRAAIAHSLQDVDVAVICGGVSVGRHDHVRQSFAELDVRERFWGVALKPGRPSWFGTRERTLVFGLPGNPVSAMVTFTLFVAPALRALAGGSPDAARTTALLAHDVEKRPGRTHATHPSGEPLPLPIRVSAGFLVKGLSGKTRIQTRPPRLM